MFTEQSLTSISRDILRQEKPGRILLAGEGEGRNAVYAASLGWEVYAFDFSMVAKKKALSWLFSAV